MAKSNRKTISEKDVDDLISELDSEFRHEALYVLASISNERRQREEFDNLASARSEAIQAAFDCLMDTGEPEFALETARANFSLWSAMARGEE